MRLEKNAKYNGKQMAEFFEVDYREYAKHQEQYLQLLNEYCVWQLAGKNSVEVLEVKRPCFVNLAESIKKN